MNDGSRSGLEGDAFVAAPAPVRGTVVAARPAERYVLETYDACQRDLYTFARSLVRDPAAAEDLVADGFLKLIREVMAGRTPDRPRAWLFRVVSNQAANHGRRRSIAARFLGRLAQHGSEDPADAGLLRSEADAAVRAALQMLPVDTRTALLLAAEGFSGREIADAIGRSEAATRTLLSRGRVRLRERLEAQEAER